MPDVDGYLSSLQSDDIRVQDSACEELADMLDAAAFPDADAPRLLTALVDRAATATEHLIQEAALNALGSGVVSYGDAAAALDLRPVVEALDRLEPGSLIMALYAFGHARQPDLRPVIERYVGHPHADVDEYAREALKALDG